MPGTPGRHASARRGARAGVGAGRGLARAWALRAGKPRRSDRPFGEPRRSLVICLRVPFSRTLGSARASFRCSLLLHLPLLLSRLSFQVAALLSAQLRRFPVSFQRDHVLQPRMWFMLGRMDLRWITRVSLHPWP